MPDISSVPSIKCRQALLPPPQASPWGPPQGDPEVGWAAPRPALRALLPNTQAAVWGEGRVNGSPLAQSPFLVLVRPAQPLWPLSGLIYWGREPHHHVLSCPERMMVGAGLTRMVTLVTPVPQLRGGLWWPW